jgi:hypothetical protein
MHWWAGRGPSLGILLEYPQTEESALAVRRQTVRLHAATALAPACSLGFVGSGNYATAVLIPAFKATGRGSRWWPRTPASAACMPRASSASRKPAPTRRR